LFSKTAGLSQLVSRSRETISYSSFHAMFIKIIYTDKIKKVLTSMLQATRVLWNKHSWGSTEVVQWLTPCTSKCRCQELFKSSNFEFTIKSNDHLPMIFD